MPGAGDYRWFQSVYTNKTADVTLLAADSSKTDVGGAVKSAKHTRFIQKLTYVPTTVAAFAITVRDDAGTPTQVALIPASQATPFVADYGPTGMALAEGKNLDFANTAGPAGTFHIEMYERLTGVIAHDAGASLQ